MGNWFKTTLLLGIMTVLIVWVGHLLGGRQGMVTAFVIAVAMNFFSYWYSHKIVLKMYKAGADYVILPHLAGGRQIAKLIKENKLDEISSLRVKDFTYIQ